MSRSRLAGEILMTVLGVILATVPVLLWVAWSPGLFALVLLTAAISAGLLILVNDRLDSDVETRNAVRRSGPVSVISDNFFAEIHRVFPLVHHHGRKQKTGFRDVMEKIRRMVR